MIIIAGILFVALLFFFRRTVTAVFIVSAIIVCLVIALQPFVAPEDCHTTPIIQDQCK